MTRDCRCPRARHQHGTLGAYQIDGCRCFSCRVNKSQMRDAHETTGNWREYNWYPAIGVARRLQALTAIGHTDRMLAARLDMEPSYVIRLRRGTNKTGHVTAPIWEAAARLYDELWDKPYNGHYSARTKRLAARKGWAAPLMWDDEQLDDPDAQPWQPKTSAPNPVDHKPCGTEAAYRRHLRRGETVDAACAAANRRTRTEKRIAQQKRQAA